MNRDHMSKEWSRLERKEQKYLEQNRTVNATAWQEAIIKEDFYRKGVRNVIRKRQRSRGSVCKNRDELRNTDCEFSGFCK